MIADVQRAVVFGPFERKTAYLHWNEPTPQSAVALVRPMHLRTTGPP